MIVLAPRFKKFQYYAVSECGIYHIAKTYHNNVPKYTVFKNKNMLLPICDSFDDAVKVIDSDKR
jgi:hypothetical protein